MNKPFVLLFAILLATAPACVEKRVVRSSSFTGLTPIATRVEEPPKPPAPPPDFAAPFKAMGRGIDKIFGNSNNAGAQPATIVNANGQTQTLPRGFNGQATMRGSDGKTYRLSYQNGSLVGVEPLELGKNPAKRPAPPSAKDAQTPAAFLKQDQGTPNEGEEND